MARTLSADMFDLLSNPRCPDQVKVAAELIRPGDPIEIDEHTARRVLAPLLWMIARTGSDGLALTKTGYLRPVDVNALMTELGWSNWWIGKANREDLTPPAAMLRRAAVASRLVRSYKGALVLTPAGRRLRDDPVALWFHVATVLPVEKTPRAANSSCPGDPGRPRHIRARPPRRLCDVADQRAVGHGGVGHGEGDGIAGMGQP